MSESRQRGVDLRRVDDGGFKPGRPRSNESVNGKRGRGNSGYDSAYYSPRDGRSGRDREYVPKQEEPTPPPPIVDGYALEGMEAMPSTGINYDQCVYECYVCDSWTNTELALNTHLAGKDHIKKLDKAGFNSFLPPKPLGPIPGLQAIKDEKWKTGEKRTYSEVYPENKGDFHCQVCDKPFDSKVVYDTHMKGKPHARMLKAKEEMKQNEDLSFSCLLCSFVGTSAVNLDIHKQGKKHKKRVEEAKIKNVPGNDKDAPKMLSQLHDKKRRN